MNKYKIFAKGYDSNIDDELKDFIKNTPFTEESHIRIMPDTHVGKGCVIGFTAKIEKFVIPNVIGVDIGCGMLVVNLGKQQIDLEKFDDIVHRVVPSGSQITNGEDALHFKPLSDHVFQSLDNIKTPLRNVDKIKRSLGTLGGGNHFVELAENDKGEKYLVIHSGSRNLGHQVASYYQKKAYDNFVTKRNNLNAIKKDAFKEVKNTELTTPYANECLEGSGLYDKILTISEKMKFVNDLFRNISDKIVVPNKEQAWLVGQDKKDYEFDMKIAQKFASRNRFWMAYNILNEYDLDTKLMKQAWETVHNYIDFDDGIVRKGSARAHKGENVIIPINMKDGSIIGIGKGNEDWNFSAPHGGGRVMSRTEAKKVLKMEDVVEQMKGVYSTTLTEKTIDEAPDAYNSMEYIKESIKDSVEIVEIIKPLYNFKG